MLPTHNCNPARALLGLLLVVGACLASADDLDMQIAPLFEGPPVRGTHSLKITVQNRGENASGEVIIKNGTYRMRYPVELPQGSKKSFIAYIDGEDNFNPVEAVLDTNRGKLKQVLRTEGMDSDISVLLISESAGLLSFIRPQNGTVASKNRNDQLATQSVEARPSLLPDRSAGYSGVSAVVLGEGAERIPDLQVEALKSYALMGGTIIIFGGASNPLLQDSRWADLLPVLDARPRSVDIGDALEKITGESVKDPVVATMVGRVAPGAEVTQAAGNVPLVVKKRLGLGNITFIAVNLLERPLAQWNGRRSMLLDVLTLTDQNENQYALQSLAGYGNEEYYGSYYMGAGGYATSATATGVSNDPFSAKLPGTFSVVSILLLYLVLVVPINLWVLRRMGKGEWAWVTAPLISLVFAGVFFRFAGNLYSAQLSVATKGVLVYDDLAPSSYFIGRSQMFFPRGGRYDLGLTNVENLSPAGFQNYPMGAASSVMDRLDPVDTGQIRVDGMAVPNLSFQEFDFRQRFSSEKWLTASLRIGTSKLARLSGSLRNSSKYSLKECKLLYGGQSYWIGDIQPGAVVDLAGKKATALSGVDVNNGYGYDGGNASALLARRIGKNKVALIGSINDFRPGPQVGKEVLPHKQIRIAAFLSGVKLEGAL